MDLGFHFELYHPPIKTWCDHTWYLSRPCKKIESDVNFSRLDANNFRAILKGIFGCFSSFFVQNFWSKNPFRVKEMTNTKNGCDYLSSSALSYYGASHKIYKASTSTTNKRWYWWLMSRSHIVLRIYFSTYLIKNHQPIEHHANSRIYNLLCIVWGLGMRNLF